MNTSHTNPRALGPNDEEAFYALRIDALTLSPHSYGNHLDAWKAARREQVLALLNHSASPSDGVILGAFDSEGALMGMLGIRRETKPNVRHKATLWGFFVRPQARNQGMGRALVAEAIRRAQGYSGLHHVRLIVTATDHAAQHVFTSQGFVAYGLEPNGICCAGQMLDQVYMILRLPNGDPTADKGDTAEEPSI